jgi:Ca2+-binding EF-hand superfamily protein
VRGLAVAFELYDLDGTGRIERSEVRRILKDIIKDNPAVQLSEDQLDEVIEEVQSQY